MADGIILQPGQEPKQGQGLAGDRLKFLRQAVITRVDYEIGIVDLQYIDFSGEGFSTPLPSAFSSIRGTVKGMPEVGSVVIVGWIRQTETLEAPIILGFLDLNLPNALDYKLVHGKASTRLTSVETMRERIGNAMSRAKRRKLYPGEIQAESKQGAELYLDESVYLSNNKLNEIEISSSDQSIRLSSLQYYQDSQACRIWNGMVTREPNKGTVSFQPTVFPDGKKVQIVTATKNPVHLGGEAFTEYRFEVREKATGKLNVTEINSGWDVTPLEPFLTFVAGTVVGNDKINDTTHYGKVLRPQIFGSPDDTKPVVSEIECLPEEFSTLASCYQLKTSSGTKIDIDKQGHIFLNIASSTGQHPLGAGRSLEAAFQGSIKLVVGAEAQRNNSIYLDTSGGIKQTIGYSTETFRSIDTTAQRAIYTQVLDGDKDGNSVVLKTGKNVSLDIQGDYNIDVAGSYRITVAGKITEEILGVKEQMFIGDMNNVYGGSYKEIVINDKQEKIGGMRDTLISGTSSVPPATPVTYADTFKILIGGRQELYLSGNLKRTLGPLPGNMTATVAIGNIEESVVLGSNKTKVKTGDIKEDITLGSIKETVTTGNINETITTGSKKTKVTTGNIEYNVTTGDIKQTISTKGNSQEKLTKGNKKVTIASGNFQVDVTKGNVSVKTKNGEVKVDSLSGKVTVNGMKGVTLKSGAKIEALAPKVNLGSIPARGGVITGMPTPSSLCFISGLPHIGSKVVSASI